MKKINTTNLISLAGLLLSGLAALLSSYGQQIEMEKTIEEKVSEALKRKGIK